MSRAIRKLRRRLHNVPAPFDDYRDQYDVDFETFDEHADTHVTKTKEQWQQLIDGWVPPKSSDPAAPPHVPDEIALKYLDRVLETVASCLSVPRYVDAYDFEVRKNNDGESEPVQLPSARREFNNPDVSYYFGCYETALLIAAAVDGSNLRVKTCYRVGAKTDKLEQRVYKLKCRMVKMVLGRNEERLLVPNKWYRSDSWALPDDVDE